MYLNIWLFKDLII